MTAKPANITPEEVTILATLLTGDETVRLWARRMGISRDVMGHPMLGDLYDALLIASDVTLSPKLITLIDRPLRDHCCPHRTLFTAARYYSDISGYEGRLQAFQRAVRTRMSRWAPQVLRFLAARIEAGNTASEARHAAELLAFAAWTPEYAGPWVYIPGEEATA